MSKQKNSIYWALFILALGVRVFLSVFQYSGDVKNHFVWGRAIISDPQHFYTRHYPGFNDPNYPPIASISFGISTFLYDQTKNLFFLANHFPAFPSKLIPLILSENTQYAFLKIPGILADLLIGLTIYFYFKKKNSSLPEIYSLIFLLNPALIYVSTTWGQIESLTMLFLLLSFTNLYKNNSLIYFCLAALTKQTALWVLPFYLFFWLKNYSLKKIFYQLSLSLIIFFLSFQCLGQGPFLAIQNYFGTLSGSSTVVSDAAWNFWFFLYPTGTNDNTLIYGFSVRTASIIILLTSLCLLIITTFYKKQKNSLENSLFIWSAIVFFFQTRVHERHFYPALIFLLLANYKFPFKIFMYIILSIYYFLNLYFSLKLPFV